MIKLGLVKEVKSVDFSQVFDVLVIGGGNAALCAAMTAREIGATVILLEASPRHFRGGNTHHTLTLQYLVIFINESKH